MVKIKINKTSLLVRAAIKRKTAAMLPDRPSQAGLKPMDIRKALFEAIIAEKGECLMGELDRIVEEVNEVLGYMAVAAGTVTIPASAWTDEDPAVGDFNLDGFTYGMAALLFPANEATQEEAKAAKLRAYPTGLLVDSDTREVKLIRAQAEAAPAIALAFKYLLIKTDNGAMEPAVAILGVDAYGEGGGTNGVDADAVKQLIREVVPAWAMESKPPEDAVKSVNGQTGAVTLHIPSTAAEVGADPAGTAESKTSDIRTEINNKLTEYDKGTTVDGKISNHNTNTDAHGDIRLALQSLVDKVNTLLNSDDTDLDQTKEIVAYIKSNKSLIDAITTSKVNVTDIVNNLTTNVNNKPLSAAQGVALKALIDALTDVVNSKQTSEQVSAAISNALTAYLTAEQIGAEYQPREEGKGLSTNDYTADEKKKLADALTVTEGDKRYAKPSDIPTIPTALKNPNKITILGKEYDGSSAVSVSVEDILDALPASEEVAV